MSAVQTIAPPLWPQPIEVLGFTGEFGSGKTLGGLTIAPGPETLAYDWEKSCASYLSLGFVRVDVPAELQRTAGQNAANITYLQMFEWWRGHVLAIPRGRFRVILLDPASDVEAGLVDWVKGNPKHFGRTTLQYEKSGGLLWGDVKQYWKLLLMEITNRCETFVFTTHMGSVWGDKAPTGKRKPKGKETLSELASLYLQLERKPDRQGNVPAKPAGTVLKSRLVNTRVNAAGEVEIVPTLPPRLPEATPAAIRRYMAAPPDYSHLTDGERAPEVMMTEDERLVLRAQVAEAERDAEQARLAREERQQARQQRPAPTRTTTPTPSTNGAPPPTATATAGPAYVAPPGKATDDQLAKLSSLRARLWQAAGDTTDEAKAKRWGDILMARGVNSARDLTTEAADELIGRLAAKLNAGVPMDRLFRGEDPATMPGGGADVDPGEAVAT